MRYSLEDMSYACFPTPLLHFALELCICRVCGSISVMRITFNVARIVFTLSIHCSIIAYYNRIDSVSCHNMDMAA